MLSSSSSSSSYHHDENVISSVINEWLAIAGWDVENPSKDEKDVILSTAMYTCEVLLNASPSLSTSSSSSTCIDVIMSIPVEIVLSLCLVPSQDVQQCACRILLNLSVYDCVKWKLIEGEHINDTLMYMLDDDEFDNLIRSYVVGIVANVATVPELKVTLVTDNNMMKKLIDLCTDEEVCVQRQACRTICSLSVNDSLKTRLLRLCVVDALLQCLLSMNCHVVWHACQALANLAALDGARTAIVDAQGLTAVIALCNSSDIKLQKQAARLLFSLSANSTIRLMIVENDGVEALVSLLLSSDSGVVRNAAGAIANLGIDTVLNSDARIIPYLLQVASCDELVLVQTTRALFTLSVHPRMRHLFPRETLFKALKFLLTMKRVRATVFQYTCGVVANLAQDQHWRVVFASSSSMIRIIVRSLLARVSTCRHSDVQFQLLRAMCALSTETCVHNVVASWSCDVLPIVNVVSGHCHKHGDRQRVYECAIMCLANFSHSSVLQKCMVQRNCLSYLFDACARRESLAFETCQSACSALRRLGVPMPLSVDAYVDSAKFDFRRLVNNAKFSDVQFVAQGRTLYAHLIFLYARCRDLYDYCVSKRPALSVSLHNTFGERALALPCPNLTYDTLVAFIEYLYTDEMTESDGVVMKQVHELAITFNLPHLRYLCATTACEQLRRGCSGMQTALSLWRTESDWLDLCKSARKCGSSCSSSSEWSLLDCDNNDCQQCGECKNGDTVLLCDKKPTCCLSESTFVSDMQALVDCTDVVGADVHFCLPDCSDVVVSAHKAILCCRSEYFDALFVSSGFRETREISPSILQIDATSGVLVELVRYLYSGTCKWTNSTTLQHTLTLLRVSNELTISHLQTQCECFLVDKIHPSNMLWLWHASYSIRCGVIQALCVHCLLHNMSCVNNWEEVRKCSPFSAQVHELSQRWGISLPWSMWFTNSVCNIQ